MPGSRAIVILDFAQTLFESFPVKSLPAILLIFPIALSLLYPGSLSAQQPLLEGKIEHSASLPPVDPHWKVGRKLDENKLPSPGSHSTIIWWRIPDWLAGTWRTTGKVKRLSLINLERSEQTSGFDAIDVKYPDAEVIGYQRDRQGYIWTCVPAPYVGRSVQKDGINISVVHSALPLELSDNQVVIRFLATTMTVDRQKGRIISVTQRESLQTYKPIETGKLLVQASMRYFDAEGNPRYESKVLSQSSRHELYKETSYLPASGLVPTLIDLRKSFDNFLRSKNMDALIPERTPLPPVRGFRLIAP